MAFAANHANNLPREFDYCPHCGKKGVYFYGGTLIRTKAGSFDGTPPGRRCKYCRKAHPDNMSHVAYVATINRPEG